jgi:hypothetical protein
LKGVDLLEVSRQLIDGPDRIVLEVS